MRLRTYQEADAPVLAGLFRDAVLITGRNAYTREQVEAWASFADDLEAFRRRLGRGITLVALEGDETIGFGQLDPTGHIALLATAPRHGRKGVATTVCRELESLAVKAGQSRLRTEASLIALPLFTRLGFVVEAKELAELKGVVFERFRMSKELAAGEPPATP
jgi:putative acetyltransferase